MIEYVIDGPIRIQQTTVSPAVYFDHWALRKLSEDNELRCRVTRALKNRSGTLMLSWINLVEFTKVTDSGQARAAENLIEGILPGLFFLESNPFTVIENEDRNLAGTQLVPPHADNEFLRAFAVLADSRIEPFTARKLFVSAQKSELDKKFDSLADTIIERCTALRRTMECDSEFMNRVKHLPSGPNIQHGTRYVLRELLRTLLIDPHITLTRNHAIDLLHAVVPASYCDLLLVDKHWEVQIERVRDRLTNAGLEAPLARTFSGKGDGVDRFLQSLETYGIQNRRS